MDTFNPKTAPPEVRQAVKWYINTRINGGVPGGTWGAHAEFTRRLQLLNCSEEYIQSAVDYAHETAEPIWRRKEGLDS